MLSRTLSASSEGFKVESSRLLPLVEYNGKEKTYTYPIPPTNPRWKVITTTITEEIKKFNFFHEVLPLQRGVRSCTPTRRRRESLLAISLDI
ncbi:hypothetical protein QE152_g9609 [Popillia japonica]|uniref:Uncharacterized protein n=1 Tax=Popillia japonica TaxID=7064 RepID=A0AAW1LYB8_POPJA